MTRNRSKKRAGESERKQIQLQKREEGTGKVHVHFV